MWRGEFTGFRNPCAWVCIYRHWHGVGLRVVVVVCLVFCCGFVRGWLCCCLCVVLCCVVVCVLSSRGFYRERGCVKEARLFEKKTHTLTISPSPPHSSLTTGIPLTMGRRNRVIFHSSPFPPFFPPPPPPSPSPSP